MPTNLQQLPSSASAPLVFQEKRAYPRFPFRGRAKAIVFPPPSSPPEAGLTDSEVVTSDLSRGGVSILYRRKLERGQQLLLVLNDTNQMVEVCWCCRVWEGLFAAGCRFLNAPGEANPEQLLAAIDSVISDECVWWEGDSRPDPPPLVPEN